jgi:hypothetical protein
MTILQAWHDSSGDTRSLQVRYDECANMLRAKGGSPIVPITEQSLFQMRQELQALQPPVVHDPAREAASRELQLLRDRYRVAAFNVTNMQRGMKSRIGKPIHKLLGDFPFDGWDRNLAAELPTNVDWRSTIGEIHAAATRAIPFVLEAEALRTQLEEVRHAADRTPPETLIWALFNKLERNERLHAQIFAELRESVELLNDKINHVATSFRRRKTHAKERPVT